MILRESVSCRQAASDRDLGYFGLNVERVILVDMVSAYRLRTVMDEHSPEPIVKREGDDRNTED